jgi:soluble lytic murein transglycosylase-like protein
MLWRLIRLTFRLFWRLPWWSKLGSAALLPLVSLNLAVAFFGNSVISPLSPFHLEGKWSALKAYVDHRPRCALAGHPQVWPLVAEAEARHGLPAGLLQAVIDVESEGRPHRISFAGAMGPAQLMPGTAKQLGVLDPFETEQAVEAAARYLAELYQKKGDLTLAVASYNAGPGAVQRAVPKNGETEFYVAKVMRRYKSGRP